VSDATWKVKMTSIAARWSQSTLSVRIITGLTLGILTGLFFGEPAGLLQPIADIYIRLMQMTVLPYLFVSLIIGLGQLSTTEAKRLALRGAGILVLVWLCASMIIVLLPLTFPEIESASFFSRTLIEPAQSISFTEIYFTANPFDSLSRNVVPAVVLFSCMVGIALIGLKDKETLLAPMRTWSAAIVRVTLFIVELTPYGVFAIAAATSGTIELETLQQLEVYLVVLAAGALLLAFLVLPLLVTAVTPFRYVEVVSIARDALLTAFVTNSAFIVLPILIERSKLLLSRHGMLDSNTDSAAEVLIPVMFNFPNAGKLLTLLFIPFAAWLSGAAMPLGEYGHLLAVGIPSYFAKAQLALPFLLDLLELPQDLFELYIPTFALLGAAAAGGFMVFRIARILRALSMIIGGTLITVVILRILLATAVDTSYDLDEAVRDMHRSTMDAASVVHEAAPQAPGEHADLSPMERIRARGSLRIGFDPNNLPMSFFNTQGDLVGFDVELAAKLATALGVKAEFVPVGWPDLPRLLDKGVIDIMPGVWYRPYWFSSLRLSNPYLTGTLGLAVRDERRKEFASVAELRASSGLKIGVPLDSSQIRTSMEYYFGDSDAEFITVEFWQPYFEGKHPELDAFLLPAENASAWSLLYPQYSVVVPQPDPVRVPSAFGMARNPGELADVVNEWIVFAENAGLVQRSYDYWVLGQGARPTEPRWSIMRDVLGWVD
jgi:Na+/H+-dicarboxylate symporter